MLITYKDGAIIEANGLLYEPDELLHLTVQARIRLAEIHNKNRSFSYEEAEKILVEEGLYDPSLKGEVESLRRRVAILEDLVTNICKIMVGDNDRCK